MAVYFTILLNVSLLSNPHFEFSKLIILAYLGELYNSANSPKISFYL